MVTVLLSQTVYIVVLQEKTMNEDVLIKSMCGRYRIFTDIHMHWDTLVVRMFVLVPKYRGFRPVSLCCGHG